MTRHPSPVPVGETARRITWKYLPAHLRSAIEQRCGSTVVDSVSMDAGFTPGFASVLTCENGSKHFVKAASVIAQKTFAASYREEGVKLARLPRDTPAPRLLWTIDEDWMVLGIEYVDAVAPRRPWVREELDATLDALETCANVLTPPPDTLDLDTFATEHAPFMAMWDHVVSTRPHLRRAADAAALAAGFADATAGNTLVHADLRDDNVLLTADGALFCDWNWPVVGADWIDTVVMLIGPRGDGLDVEVILAERPLTRDVPPGHVDAVLALLTGYFLRSSDHPVPHISPWIRDHQRWQGEVCWDWLSERRGWT